jgi:hypothetical protein
MIVWAAATLFIIGGSAALWAAHFLYLRAEALRDECQMMRTSRSAATQCPLAGKVK